ncbi:MAG: O-antigen ligase family protein [Pseudomonadota bacterium]
MDMQTLRSNSSFLGVIAILAFAIGFGGGGSKYGMANLIVQLVALLALAFHQKAFFDFWRSAPIALKALIAFSILLPAAMLFPLPPSLWSALPGREAMMTSLELVGGVGWSSASVEPVRTLLALTAMITPVALLTIGWSAARQNLITAGWIVVAMGIANFLLGVPQVLTNSETGVFYPENPMPGVLFGTFANRNTTGLFLVAALAMAAMLPAHPRFGRAALGIRIGACILLLVAIVLTRSRTALVLSILPLALVSAHVLIHRARLSGQSVMSNRRRAAFIIAPILLGLVTAGTVTVTAPGRVGDVTERFMKLDEDARAYIWEDAAYSASRYWPVGSGMGTFDDVFQLDESLENMTQRTAGRAHNDYLEIAIEAGGPGLALIAGWLALVIWLSWRARRSPDKWIAWSGAIVLLAIALQSITDYPLRNHSMLAVGAYALLVLARFGQPRRGTGDDA